MHSQLQHFMGANNLHAQTTLFPEKGPLVPNGEEAGWIPCLVWKHGAVKRNPAPVKNWTLVQPTANPLYC